VIANNEENALKSVKGIGLKTAQRIIVDLKNKVSTTCIESLPGQSTTVQGNGEVTEEAIAALVMLGFQKAASAKVVSSILKSTPGLAVEQVIKTALRML
jgi:Holliday junction DNA helicase RuvA